MKMLGNGCFLCFLNEMWQPLIWYKFGFNSKLPRKKKNLIFYYIVGRFWFHRAKNYQHDYNYKVYHQRHSVLVAMYILSNKLNEIHRTLHFGCVFVVHIMYPMNSRSICLIPFNNGDTNDMKINLLVLFTPW